ncbi:MAG TPA: hypothetical protein CFH81_04425 [Sulfurovum sp. UBA12169]|nr:MAG TPA: hypothetical protein CFH81_04425 [Sulfurovum sp. UBA12169]
MIDLVLTLVFSIVMLLFMIFPAMKIAEWLNKKFSFPEKWYNILTFLLTVLLSLLVGIFLRFA